MSSVKVNLKGKCVFSMYSILIFTPRMIFFVINDIFYGHPPFSDDIDTSHM